MAEPVPVEEIGRRLMEIAEPLKPGEAANYCGRVDRRDKRYYCVRPQHQTGRHRYGVVMEVQVRASANELEPKS